MAVAPLRSPEQDDEQHHAKPAAQPTIIARPRHHEAMPKPGVEGIRPGVLLITMFVGAGMWVAIIAGILALLG